MRLFVASSGLMNLFFGEFWKASALRSEVGRLKFSEYPPPPSTCHSSILPEKALAFHGWFGLEGPSTRTGARGGLFLSSLSWQSALRLRSSPKRNALRSPLWGLTWSATAAAAATASYLVPADAGAGKDNQPR